MDRKLGIIVLAIIMVFVIVELTPALDCYESTIVSPVPFMGNHEEVFKLADGTFWEVRYEYEYMYQYYPTVIICPSQGKMILDGEELNVRSLNDQHLNIVTLTYTAGENGSIMGEATQIVDLGSDGTAVEAFPDEGYRFIRWSDGVTENPRTDTNVTADISVTATFHMPGDINADDKIDLSDAILALQVISGESPAAGVHSGADIDGDGRIGLKEAIFVLQVVSHMRDMGTVGPDSFTNSLGMTFNRIPAGTFMMGSSESEPERYSDETQHQVTLTKSYYMQTTEVTQGQWKAVMGSNPSLFFGCGDDCPVEEVSWNDIQSFITELNKLGQGTYRLPTEAEWEYAARAGTTTPFNTGNCLSTDQANYDGNYPYTGCPSGVYREKTLPVASFAPNAWGLYDMHGNVHEWVQDWYGTYPSGPVIDPSGPSTGSQRVLRGGCWIQDAGICRSALRYRSDPGYRYSLSGFRLVLP